MGPHHKAAISQGRCEPLGLARCAPLGCRHLCLPKALAAAFCAEGSIVLRSILGRPMHQGPRDGGSFAWPLAGAPMSQLGHSLPGRASGKSGHVRYAADSVAKVVLRKVSKILRAAGAVFV